MIIAPRDARPLTPEQPDDVTHHAITQGWTSAADRVAPSRRRIVICRAIRRGLMTVAIPSGWLSSNHIASGWLEAAVPERWMIDLTMTNLLGESEVEYTRTPLGTTDTAQDDADKLETWVGSVERDKRGGTDYDAMTGLSVQDGEWASIVLPTLADMRRPPAYREQVTARNGTVVRVPKPSYDRDERGKPSDAPGYGGRSERKSRGAYDDAYQSWLARNHPWTTRLVSATDCAPIMTRGLGRSRWECTGLFVRTLYDHELLIDAGWQWDGMEKAGEMIPREHGTDSRVGDGGQIYIYEAFLRTRKGGVFCAYSVGGCETWMADSKGRERSTVIDFTEEYGIPEGETLWSYHYGLHFEDEPAYRGVPLLWPLSPTLLNLEALRTAVNAAVWATSFTGHTQRPDPNVPPTAYLDGHGQFKPWTPPLPGEVKPAYGEIAPFQQAQVGEGAWRAMAEQRAQLQSASPDPAQQGGDASGRSGHSLVLGQDLLQMGKRQIKGGILDCGTSIVYRKLMIASTFLKPSANLKEPIEWPVFVRREEVLPSGEARARFEVLPLKERWVGDNYWMEADFPKEGNLADIKLAMELAMAGFATDEDVFEARGKKSTLIERAKIANYQWIKSPEGQMALQQRAAQYRGDLEKLKLLEMVKQAKMSPGGTPTAAIEGGGAPQGAPGVTPLPSPADSQLQGIYQGAIGSAARSNDARAQMSLQAAGSGQSMMPGGGA